MHAEFKLLRDQLLVFEFAIWDFNTVGAHYLLSTHLVLQLSKCALWSTCQSNVYLRVVGLASHWLTGLLILRLQMALKQGSLVGMRSNKL